MKTGVGAIVVHIENKVMLKILDFCSIFSVKNIAISHSLDIIKINKIDKVIIFSDSLSSLVKKTKILTDLTTYLEKFKIRYQLLNPMLRLLS